MEEKGWGRTVTPNWLRNPQLLQALLDAEKNNPDEFCPVPQHYMELTQLFLRSCQNTDRPISQQVLSLVDLLWSVRAEKRRAGVEGADLVNTLAFRLDNLTMLEANHFRRIAQLALDFNLDAKMAFEGEVSPPELESLNRRRGNLAELLGLGNIPRLSQSDLYSGQRFSRSTFEGSDQSGTSGATSQQSGGTGEEDEDEDDLSRRPWMGGSAGAPPSNKLRRL
ncbi:partner of sld five, psf2 protein [Acanthamoeba castellanii str. Neff]|uniref:Partner of sld five, psf2 protein n=1 Tax=Acanthamoeba castellanii (strain ATCC 30010 / Neff) TaxID=1257118 RepID=L8GE47_ACACF|nr:partner of sld five, psf2 protein [Acanthamoeba castellanii str. Neff]ELR11307.1 partner of sld five, psf2 protein [Acanthamoeba castellanii str. Neff]